MKNVDRWFILIGLLYGTFGFAFGIWVAQYPPLVSRLWPTRRRPTQN